MPVKQLTGIIKFKDNRVKLRAAKSFIIKLKKPIIHQYVKRGVPKQNVNLIWAFKIPILSLFSHIRTTKTCFCWYA